MCRELQLRNLEYVQQVELPISYKGVRLDCGYRIDLIVGNRVLIELKSVQEIWSVHEAQ
jgi:GxxExxY protein